MMFNELFEEIDYAKYELTFYHRISWDTIGEVAILAFFCCAEVFGIGAAIFAIWLLLH